MDDKMVRGAVDNDLLRENIEAMTRGWLDTLESPEATAAGCTWLLAVLGDVSDLASARRAAAVHQLTVDGWSLSEIGAALGISRARVHQLVNR